MKFKYYTNMSNGSSNIFDKGYIWQNGCLSFKITTHVSYCQYDLGNNGQGQIYVKSVLWIITQTSYTFTIGAVLFICHNDCIWFVVDKG